MQFKDIVGQADIKRKLMKSVRESRISHAQLFTGPEGSGKLALAIAYAQYICCENRSADDSCGVCTSCHKIQKYIHPDLHFVFPIFLSDKKDDDDKDEKIPAGKLSDVFIAQWREALLENPYMSEKRWYEKLGIEKKLGIIGTTESSEVIRKISLKSFESDYKSMVIWLPERMNIQAANKLLKLIEEPPAKTVFLMVSESPDSIIKTIISRTQIVKIPPINRDEIATALVERFQINPAKAQDFSRVANGSFQTAMALATSEEGSPYFELFRDLMRFCYSNNILGLLEWVNKVSAMGRERQKELLSHSIQLIRESFMLNLGLDDIVYIAGEEADFGKKFAPFVNGKNITSIYTELGSAIEHIVRNGNPHIVFTDLAMKLVKLIEKKNE